MKHNENTVCRYHYIVADYEHSGDLDAAVSEIKKVCPEACNFHTWEEEDYEAEADYRSEYGDEDFESIYQGYVEFDAPLSAEKELSSLDCYKVK